MEINQYSIWFYLLLFMDVLFIVDSIGPCGSCKNDCGITSTTCGCDPLCLIHGDCCSDFKEECKEEYTQGNGLYKRFSLSNDAITSCIHFKGTTKHYDLSIVTGCPLNPNSCLVTNDTVSQIPVMELRSGLHFINARCARCHGVQDAQVWETVLMCDEIVVQSILKGAHEKQMSSDELNQGIIQSFLRDSGCEMELKIPKSAQRLCDPNIVDTCPKDMGILSKLCESGPTGYITDGVNNYKNNICAQCNNPINPVMCGLQTHLYVLGSRPLGDFSLSILMDFNSENGLLIRSKSCDPGYRKIGPHCLPIICNSDEYLKNNTCVLIPKLQIAIDFYFQLSTSYLLNETMELLVSNYTRTELVNKLFLYLKSKYKRIEEVDVNFNSSAFLKGLFRSRIPGFLTYILVNKTEDSLESNPPSLDIKRLILNKIKEMFRKENINISTDIELYMQPMIVDDIRTGEVVDCNQVKLYNHLYTINDDTLEIASTRQTIPMKYVLVEKDYAIICENYLESETPAWYLGIITIVVLAISLFCLLVRIVLQFCISVYHTAPMKVQFCLCLCLFTGFLCFLLAPLIESDTIGCQVIGIYIHWIFLSAFCWKLAIAFDMWWIFRPSGGFLKISEGEGFFWRYFILVLIIPSVIIAISLSLEYTNINQRFKPFYGLDTCFFNNNLSLLTLFAAPLILIVIINLVFFTLTCFNLHKALSSIQQFQRQKLKDELLLYIRLFVLMGATWILGIVAPFVRNDILWISFIVLNGLQGFYIFIAYVCTKKVFKELRYKCCSGTDKQQFSSKSGNNSTHETNLSRKTSTSSAKGDSFKSYVKRSNDDTGSPGYKIPLPVGTNGTPYKNDVANEYSPMKEATTSYQQPSRAIKTQIAQPVNDDDEFSVPKLLSFERYRTPRVTQV